MPKLCQSYIKILLIDLPGVRYSTGLFGMLALCPV